MLDYNNDVNIDYGKMRCSLSAAAAVEFGPGLNNILCASVDYVRRHSK